MATGDETQAGARPAIPPRRPGGVGDPHPDTQATHKMSGDGGFPERPPLTGFGAGQPEPEFPAGRGPAPKPQILAPQANDWATGMEEVEVVKSRRAGLVLLFLLALLVVAVIALGLAALSVFGGGDDLDETATGGTTESTIDTTESLPTTPTTEATTIPDPTKLQVVITEEPFICDGGTRQFGQLSGAAPNEQVAFSSPQSAGLKAGMADADGVLPIRWQCDPEQAGTTWELTATGATSGKSATFIFAGAIAPPTASTAEPTSLTVNLVEDPFKCDGATRIFGGLTGAAPNEEVAFTSPQASNISSGTADADGALSIRWQCAADKVGTTWELTATGVTSGRSVSFSFTGS